MLLLRYSTRLTPIFRISGYSTRDFHKTTNKQKLYELRVYQLKPECTKPFMELSKEWLHLRLNHSLLIGYWTSEIGGINDVVHIWEYDNLEHRAKVRQALAGDANWISNYFSKILPLMSRQENDLLLPKDNLDLFQPDLKGVYELEMFKGKSVDRPKDKLLGSFTGLIGSRSKDYNLWFHQTQDNMVKSATEAKLKQGSDLTGRSRLLLPTPWSPLG